MIELLLPTKRNISAKGSASPSVPRILPRYCLTVCGYLHALFSRFAPASIRRGRHQELIPKRASSRTTVTDLLVSRFAVSCRLSRIPGWSQSHAITCRGFPIQSPMSGYLGQVRPALNMALVRHGAGRFPGRHSRRIRSPEHRCIRKKSEGASTLADRCSAGTRGPGLGLLVT